MRELRGGNLDLDLVETPPWPQDKCPWNIAEGTTVHRCAVKNVSLCDYFRGVKVPDTVLCSYGDKN